MRKVALALVLLIAAACSTVEYTEPQIVPAPQSVKLTGGSMDMKGVAISCDAAMDARSLDAVKLFADRLSLVSGESCQVVSGGRKGLNFRVDASVPAEGYGIRVRRGGADVRASGFEGFLYAIQTLKQMLPVSVYGTEPDPDADWGLPCCEIEDAPRFGYRGLMLDCCRHFFSVDEVKKVLDVMSIYKLNRLHWHLSEDQGWRIQIDKYPRLTEVGAWRDGTMVGGDWKSNDGIRYGGFYTKDQIRDVIAYAEARGITIVPEIDLPGHMQAALASYPELGCKGSKPQPYKVWTIWGVSKQVLNVGSEKTMRFLEDVLGEVADLFPGEYIHIGGDECPRDEWKTDPDCQAKIRELGLVSDENASAEARLQNYVTARMQKFLAGKGKKIIGWDEILEGELAEGATVMSWRGTKGGIKAAGMGYDVIMSPTTYCYLDYVQSPDLANEPFSITHQWATQETAWKSAVTLDKLYGYEPLADIPEEAQKHILGVQCNLWTEYIATPEHLEYMLLPRVLALSEVQWCAPEKKDYRRFTESLDRHEFQVLDILGCNYRKPSHPEWSYDSVIYEVNVRQYSPEGTFKGVKAHLPRLKDLGVDVLWLMPMYKIGEAERKGSLGSYYAISDYCAVNPEFGTMEDFDELLDAAHKDGFKVILDWVANQTAPDHIWIDGRPADFYERDSLGNAIWEYDWTDTRSLNYENEAVWAAQDSCMRFWLDKGVDGFRCDAAGEMPAKFWLNVVPALKRDYPGIYMLAEAEKPELADPSSSFDATYAWELHHLLNDIAKGEKGIPELKAYLDKDKVNTPPGAFRMTFTSNHDENSWSGTEFERMGDAAGVMAVLCFTLPKSQPLIYTGQEIGLSRRLAFFEKDPIEDWSPNEWTAFWKSMVMLKHANPALAAGEKGGNIKYIEDVPNGVFAFSRAVVGNKVTVYANLTPDTVRLSDGRMLAPWGYDIKAE